MGRMDRYNNDDSASKRSNKNQDLYKSIYELGKYSNIEGIATIDNSNEVDITKVKNMLKNREDYQKQKEIRNINSTNKEVSISEPYEREEEKVYDIRDILNKARINKTDNEEYKSLDNINFEILKELKEKNTVEKETQDLKELLDTISHTSQLNKLSDQELGLNMLNELKSEDNTVIGDKESIKVLLEEARKNDDKKLLHTDSNIDKSFFTSSLNFGKDDFDQIKEITKKKKKLKTTKLLIFIILSIIALAIIFFVFNMIK